jgi:hypothetical protein
VLAQVFTGFIVQYPDPKTTKLSTIFLQIPHASSRTGAAGNGPGEYRSCQVSGGGRTIIFGANLSEKDALQFTASPGPLRHLDYSINDYLCKLIEQPITCRSADGTTSPPATLLDGVKSFGDWKIHGAYVGLETQNKDLRPQSKTADPQGSTSVALQISGLHVLRHPDLPFSPTDCRKLR